MGRLRLEYTAGSLTTFFLSRSNTSKLTKELSIEVSLDWSVVSDRLILFPTVPSFFNKASVQKEVFEPELRNAERQLWHSLFSFTSRWRSARDCLRNLAHRGNQCFPEHRRHLASNGLEGSDLPCVEKPLALGPCCFGLFTISFALFSF